MLTGAIYRKRYVTRQIIEERAGLIWCRDTWLDGTTRLVGCQPWQLERWLDGATRFDELEQA